MSGKSKYDRKVIPFRIVLSMKMAGMNNVEICKSLGISKYTFWKKYSKLLKGV